MHFYVPASFDAAAALPEGLRRYADCANYLLHCIVRGQAFGRADSGGFVWLKAGYMRSVIPSRFWTAIRRALVVAGVIECDGHYQREKKSMGYRLTEAHGGPARRVECMDADVRRKVRALRDTKFRTEPRLPVHKHLRAWLDRLEVDMGQAEAIALGLENPQWWVTAVDMIAAGHVQFSYCAAGRVHTNLTWLKKELRPALRVGGKPLVGVDVKNCQPLLLALLVAEYRKSGDRFLDSRTFGKWRTNPYLDFPVRQSLPRDLFPSEPCNPGGGGAGRVPGDSLSSPSNTVRIAGEAAAAEGLRAFLSEDETAYLDACEEGLFYEVLREKAGMGSVGRDAFKDATYSSIFYGKFNPAVPLLRTFISVFPGVAEVIREAKSLDHRHMAFLTQRLESSIVIGGACGRLMRQHPSVPIFTLHDSLFTTPGNVGLVEMVMSEEFGAVGLRPVLKVG